MHTHVTFLINFSLTPLGLFYQLTNISLILGVLFTWLQKFQGLNSAPKFIREIMFYGKSYNLVKKCDQKVPFYSIQVPKRFFWHYYVVSFVINGTVLLAVLNKSFRSENFHKILNFLSTPILPDSFENLRVKSMYEIEGYDKLTQITFDRNGLILLLTCMVIQASRRLYECLFVSVYSNSTQSIFVYLSAFVYYAFQGASILVGSPNIFIPQQEDNFSLLALKTAQYAAILLFLVASYIQYDTHQRLANLRKTGKIKQNQHGLPQGGLFKYLSSPHYFAEAVIYISFQCMIGWQHIPSLIITFCTVFNQFCCAGMSHLWYKSVFGKGFPRNRKVFVPFVY